MSLLRLAILIPAIIFITPAHAETSVPAAQIVRRSQLDKMIRTFARRAEAQRAKSKSCP